MDPNIIQGALSNIYNVSNFKLGDFSLAQLIGYLPEIKESGAFGIIKLILIIVSLILGVLFIIVIIKLNGLIGSRPSIAKEIMPPQPAEGGALNARWTEVLKHINSNREAEWKFAVIEADKLIDEILKTAGFPGESLGERLMAIEPGQLASLDGLWSAHKTRNKIAHEPNYFMRHAEAKKAVEQFEATLKELGVLS